MARVYRLHVPAALFVLGLAVAGLAMACGDRDGSSGADSGPEPVLAGPPSAYAPALEELEGLYEVNRSETYSLSQATFATLAGGPFPDTKAAEDFAKEWGYQGGFTVLYQPDGLLAGVLQGRYYITVQVHQFSSTEGAKELFARFSEQGDTTRGSERMKADRVGNESGAWAFVQGTVGNSEMVGIYHRVVFRRGNIVGVVITYGGEPYMTIERALAVARIMDERATGGREAVEPTPIARPTSPAF